MKPDFDSFVRTEEELGAIFGLLATTQQEIRLMLEGYADGKTLKGDELVGWLGEIYAKILFRGKLVDDSHEHDVETPNGWTISVKTRRGEKKSWKRSSAIPRIEGDDCPSHLAFVHISEKYQVQEIWLYPWDDLLELGRFKRHIVRGKFRSFYMSVNPGNDRKYRIYSADT